MTATTCCDNYIRPCYECVKSGRRVWIAPMPGDADYREPMHTTDVIAEDAPLGVQLWPTTAPQYAPNFTLAEVHTVRTAAGTHVKWVYESGEERTFQLGEKVACEFR